MDEPPTLSHRYAAAALASMTWLNIWLCAITGLLCLLVWRLW